MSPGSTAGRRPGSGARPEPPFLLLHPKRISHGPDGEASAATAGSRDFGPPVLLREPERVLAADDRGDVPALLREAERWWERGRWVAGFLAYEAAPGLDPALATRPPGRLPLAWMAGFEAPASAGQARRALEQAGAWRTGARESTLAPDEHREAVSAIRASIRDGDFYQVALTHRLRADFEGDGLGLYRDLHRAQGGALHAYLRLPGHEIVSASPELLLRREGRRLATRPMKGTAGRGRWPEEDRERARALAASEKERAENLMILDMARNDLSRVCRPGSVRVTGLWEVERHPTLWQMTSTAAGELEEGRDLADVLRALFPAASVTGAPKPAAMARIARAEETPRGVYCGAVGLMVPEGAGAGRRGGAAPEPGSWTFSVGIRTAWIDRAASRVEYGTGGGITWDSDPGAERREAASKAAVLEPPDRDFRLLETLRLEDGALPRRGRHLERLAASADYFGFAPPGEAARGALEAVALRRPEGRWRVRLTAAADGSCEAEAVAYPDPPPEPAPVAAADEPVDADDPMLFHKTTRRAPYRRRRERRPDCFDVVLANRAGRATELTRGNLVVEIEDRRITPPRGDGLLAGTFRAALIEAGRLEVGPLPLERLAAADRLWMVNSLRGWVELELADAPEPGGA